jgi:Protein of unknown function (DUF1524)
VLPEKPEGNWPQFTDEQVKLYYMRIGNLCLMRASANSTIKSSAFSAKKPIFAVSPYVLMKQISDAADWTTAEIAGETENARKHCRKDMGNLTEVDAGQLKRAVEAQHGCTATLIQSVPVKETFGDKTVWEGTVHVFKINGHPEVRRAYAWSSPIEGSDKRRFFAVLHQPPVMSLADVVRAAIVAEH